MLNIKTELLENTDIQEFSNNFKNFIRRSELGIMPLDKYLKFIEDIRDVEGLHQKLFYINANCFPIFFDLTVINNEVHIHKPFEKLPEITEDKVECVVTLIKHFYSERSARRHIEHYLHFQSKLNSAAENIPNSKIDKDDLYSLSKVLDIESLVQKHFPKYEDNFYLDHIDAKYLSVLDNILEDLEELKYFKSWLLINTILLNAKFLTRECLTDYERCFGEVDLNELAITLFPLQASELTNDLPELRYDNFKKFIKCKYNPKFSLLENVFNNRRLQKLTNYKEVYKK